MNSPMFIDTDTASDDAVALMMAFAHRGDSIVGVGTVAGNCPVEQACINALYTAELCDADVPVHLGEAGPAARAFESAQHVHGQDGMGDIGLVATELAEGEGGPSAGHAADALIAASHAHMGKLEVVALGPLTNVAKALKKDPGLAGRVGRCFIMGGASDSYGNITPVSEYNIWADPEAAETVFSSGMSITMIGWDISRKYATFDSRAAAELRAIGTTKAAVAVDCQKTLMEFCRDVTGVDGFDLPDPVAMAVALDPHVVTDSIQAAVHVGLGDDLTRGQTIVDDRQMTERECNVTIVRAVSRSGFVDLLQRALI